MRDFWTIIASSQEPKIKAKEDLSDQDIIPSESENCPKCGTCSEIEPYGKHDEYPFVYKRTSYGENLYWQEVHKCQSCGQSFEFENGY